MDTPANCNSASMPSKPLRIIGAACRDMGIGSKGGLPWDLPKEFKFFKDSISTVSAPGKKNLLIWGKRCWFSTFEGFHPVENTIHVILSQALTEVPVEGHYVCRDFESAINLASSPPLAEQIETIWAVGGTEVYKEAIMHPWCDLIFLTDIMADFECDIFFPEFDRSVYQLQKTYPGLPDDIQEENGIKYKFQVFKRTN